MLRHADRARTTLGRALSALDRPELPWLWYTASFLGIYGLRLLLEAMSTGYTSLPLPRLAHYLLFYLSLGSWTAVALHLVGRTSPGRALRLLACGFTVLLVAPIVDLVSLPPGSVMPMNYLLPGKHDNLLERFVTFGGVHTGLGITLGQKVEVALAMAGVAAVAWHDSSRLWRGGIAAFLFYVIVFAHAVPLHFIAYVHSLLSIRYLYSDAACLQLYLVSLLICGLFLAQRAAPGLMREYLRDLRLERIAHFELMYLIGAVVGHRTSLRVMGLEMLGAYLLTPVAVVFAALFAIITNNVVDLESDRLTNQDRPLVRGAIDPGLYARSGWLFGGLAMLYALAAHELTVLAMLVLMGGYSLYSLPPLRLKRLPLVSKLIISTNSLILFIVGFVHAGGLWNALPGWLPLFFATALTVAVTFIDLKDTRGDAAQRVWTLPVLLGERAARVISTAGFFACLLAVHLFLGDLRLVPALVLLAALLAYLLQRRAYRETWVFAAFLLGLVGLALYLGLLAPDALFEAFRKNQP